MAGFSNIEIKAKTNRFNDIKSILEDHSARFMGQDRQVDTYFEVNYGRLKIREGNIENALIYYIRANHEAPNQSDISMLDKPDPVLKHILAESVGILAVVDKVRLIYFIDNVKFHLDKVKSLGTFVEIEAIDYDGSIGLSRLHQQCHDYMKILRIERKDLVKENYSDMLIKI